LTLTLIPMSVGRAGLRTGAVRISNERSRARRAFNLIDRAMQEVEVSAIVLRLRQRDDSADQKTGQENRSR
jgi:hypothetical protein